jgi:hypothetical protein
MLEGSQRRCVLGHGASLPSLPMSGSDGWFRRLYQCAAPSLRPQMSRPTTRASHAALVVPRGKSVRKATRSTQPVTTQSLDPLTVEDVSLALWHALDGGGTAQAAEKAVGFSYLKEWKPIGAGRFHRHRLHAAVDKPVRWRARNTPRTWPPATGMGWCRRMSILA